ncbi:Ulp1 family type III secretion system effector isopeptidase XopD [Paracidovorax citrulli]|uniref:Ulp1 family type III secretion system effector isopeptidase XopD n=1 Tax=Paracidovorax citrulli TaxID=80869 RepID=UPI0009F45382|nr:Ulp1 family type III secretion system effector isopeptidase XopD [Paracidovorax citrulli]UMT89649.1 hypothetical protein FRC90_17300 [Paracidovorax citrulli]WIY35581.1 Ulp1 family type III secretion system effector isopeptidase XopD [Paracidovorax citrulli]
MENFFNFDINSYRRMTAAMDEPHASPPSPRNDGNRTQSFHMYPLRDTLPPLEIAHGPVQSSVHRMRAPAPKSKALQDIAKLLEIIPRFAAGESWDSLAGDFPNLGHYMTDYGISDQPYVENTFRNLDNENLEYIAKQTENRINILYSGEYREMALQNLASKLKKIRSQPNDEGKIVDSHTIENEYTKYYRDLIKTLMDNLGRFEAGESFSSLKKDIPNIKSYLTDSGFTKHANRLLEHVTAEEKKRFDRAFKRRSRASHEQRPALTGSLGILQSHPEMLLAISKKFSNRSNSIEEGVCDDFITPFTLRKIVKKDTGELTYKGEEVISRANPSMQAAIRANFRLRYQAPPEPATETAPPHQFPSHGQHHAQPGDSFFSGFSGEVRRYQDPPTPQYPPASPAFSGAAPYYSPYYGQPYAPPSDSFFSGFSGEVRRYQDPTTPQYPPASPAFSGAAPYYSPYYGQPYAPPGDSFFSGFSDEMRRKGYAEPETPQYPQSPASTFGDLSSLNEGTYSARDFDLNTPAEVTQPWPGDDHYSATPVASSHERIDVDALPSPQDSSTSISAARELGPSEEEWLGDEHMVAYIGTIADRLEGQPRAELLNFADSLLVTQLIQGDREQRQNAMHQIMGRGGPIIFMPINAPNSHWSLLVIDQRNGDAFHYDSLVRPQDAAQAVDTKQYELARDAARAMDVYTPVRGMPIAHQRDGHSCGDHVLQAMDVLAHSVIDGTFGQQHTMDLSDLETDRGLIADTIASARAHRNAEPAPAASRTHERPAKKSKKWWKF